MGLALVLLVVGLIVGHGLTLVYLSIATSLVSAVFLGLGTFARRGAAAGQLGTDAGGVPPDGTLSWPAAGGPRAAGGEQPLQPLEAPGAPSVAGEEATTTTSNAVAAPERRSDEGDVTLVPARASGRGAPPPARPEAAPAEAATGRGRRGATAGLPAVSASTVFVVPGRPRYHRAGCRFLTGRPAEALEMSQAREQGYTACAVCRADDSGVAPDGVGGSGLVPAPDVADTPEASSPARPAPQRVRRAAAAPPPDSPPRPAGGSRSLVAVIPERDRFHRPDCRFVRDAAGVETLTRAAATRRGYVPCGVCRP